MAVKCIHIDEITKIVAHFFSDLRNSLTDQHTSLLHVDQVVNIDDWD